MGGRTLEGSLPFIGRLMKRSETIGIIYNPRAAEAEGLISALMERLNLGDKAWVCPASDDGMDVPQAKDTDLIITVGGDGTIIRAARVSVPHGIPILGVNMGRLGFMTELKGDEALDKVPQYLEGDAWVEERSMLLIRVISRGRDGDQEVHTLEDAPAYNALNDVVVGRGAVSRLARIDAFIDGTHLTEYRADAVIVSSATGSTGYNLSAGGPILPPQSGEMIVTPVAPHAGMAPAMVVSQQSVVDLIVESDREATLSVDGYMDSGLAPGQGVRVQQSPSKASFLRANPPDHFYATLTTRLGFGWEQSGRRALL